MFAHRPSRITRSITRLALALLVIAPTPALLAGQSTRPSQDVRPTPDARPSRVVSKAERRSARVEVHNFNWLDVRVYVVRDGIPVPLGYVTSTQAETFELPPMATNAPDIQLMVLPIGSTGVYLSEPLGIDAGQTLELEVADHLALSSLSVLPRDRTR